MAIVVRNLQPLFQVRRHLALWPVTRPHALVGLGAVACFGLVDIVSGLTDLPVAADLVLVAAASLVYVAGIWRGRAVLGLEVFRTALRRRRPPAMAAPVGAVHPN